MKKEEASIKKKEEVIVNKTNEVSPNMDLGVNLAVKQKKKYHHKRHRKNKH